MARQLAVPTSRFEGREINPLDLIVNQEENGRAFPYTREDVEDILADLNAGRGISQPVIVRPVKRDSGQFLKLFVGYRRWLASKIYVEEGHPDFLLPTLLQEPKDDKAALILNIRENVARKSLTIIDLGRNAQRLAAEGMTQKEIKEILGVGSEAQVSQAIKLVTELNEALQIQVAKGIITADDAFALLKVEDPEERTKIVQGALEAAGTKVIESNERKGETDAESEGKEAHVLTGLKASRGARSEAIREGVRSAGGNVSRKMPQLKKYLKQAIDEEGPGSNKGEVFLKKALLEFIEGEFTDIQMDNRFNKVCKEKF